MLLGKRELCGEVFVHPPPQYWLKCLHPRLAIETIAVRAGTFEGF